MSFVALSDVKAGVQASDFTDDDMQLQLLTDAAEVAIQKFLRRDFSTDFPNPLPSDLKQSVIMLVAYWYDNPTPEVTGERPAFPTPVALLLEPYRDLS